MPTNHDDPVGTAHAFQVWDPQHPTSTSRIPLRAHLVAKSPHADWYVQDGLTLSPKTLPAAISSFEDTSYPEVHRLLGWNVPPRIDGNARVTILIGQFPSMQSGAAAFDVRDLEPGWVFAGSNQRKLIYVNDTTIESDVSPLAPQLTYTLALLAWAVARTGPGWLGARQHCLARRPGGERLALADSQLLMINMFALSPDTSLTTWRPDQTSPAPLALVGAHYLFARYVADRFGATSVFPAVFASSDRGVDAYDHYFHTLQPATSFDAVFADWVAANYLDDPHLADGRYGYRSDINVSPKVFPGPTLNQSVRGHASQFGATYYRIDPSAPATLTFTGDPTVPLIGANPHVGGYEWWSNRGAAIDSRLTRSIDLRSVKSATLNFWAWFDTEEGYDYAYVEASTDNAATWRTLATSDTTRAGPERKKSRDGFTGTSGGASLRWLPETVDLSPEAGHVILLRFEYVTDPWVNGDGFVVNNVQIPRSISRIPPIRTMAGSPKASSERITWPRNPGWSRSSPPTRRFRSGGSP